MACSERMDGKVVKQKWGRWIFLLTLFIFMVFAGGISAAERLAITSKIANVRSGPGTTHDILWQVEKYHPLIVLEEKEGWIHFKDFEGDNAWVHKSLVGKASTVISKKDNCNVRSGPGTHTKVVFTVEKGVPFKVLDKKNGWLHIKHVDGDTGWISGSLVW